MSSLSAVAPLLRLLQLVSPSFPIGAFAYSQGLEAAISNGWVEDAPGTQEWLSGLMHHSLAFLEIPIYFRARKAFRAGDSTKLSALIDCQLACREARELQEEDLQLGRSMLRAARSLGAEGLDAVPAGVTYVVAFACTCEAFGIETTAGAEGFVYAWCENQVMAASRLIPLGQTQTQQVLSNCMRGIPRSVSTASAVQDEQIGLSAPGLGIASAQHETQYARLFRS